MAKWQIALQEEGWNSLFWNNHDLPRIVSRFGNDKEFRVESAKMLAMLLHGMKGTPYIYQGEEIGMTNVQFDSIEEYQDIETRNMYRERIEKGEDKEQIMQSIYAKGRDNARTPMQWDHSPNAGFTTGTPWIKVNPNYQTINVEQALYDPNSIFYCYQKLIQLRHEKETIRYGSFTLLLEKDHPRGAEGCHPQGDHCQHSGARGLWFFLQEPWCPEAAGRYRGLYARSYRR